MHEPSGILSDAIVMRLMRAETLAQENGTRHESAERNAPRGGRHHSPLKSVTRKIASRRSTGNNADQKPGIRRPASCNRLIARYRGITTTRSKCENTELGNKEQTRGGAFKSRRVCSISCFKKQRGDETFSIPSPPPWNVKQLSRTLTTFCSKSDESRR